MPPCIHLTFDDGPGPSTPALLDVLQQGASRATFFVLGGNLARAMDVAVRLVREGHELGNHSYSHAQAHGISLDALHAEILATDDLIREVFERAGLPHPATIPLRLPYGLGAQDARQAVLTRLGRPHVGWTAMVDDWRRPPPAPASLLDAMRAHISAQYIAGRDTVLCLHDSSRHHETRPATVAAVRLLLRTPEWRRLQQVVPAREKTHAGPQAPELALRGFQMDKDLIDAEQAPE